MKYVKTKDGIIEKSKIKFLPNGKVELTDGHGSWQIDDFQIIKESNNLDELCDEFVIVNNADDLPYRINQDVFNEQFHATGYHCLDYAIERFEDLKKFIGTKEKHDEYADFLYEQNPNYQFEGCIYGAIWTKWGLKYVAKLNEKGELKRYELR